ncbi:uncharacterized protein N7459_008297 [Penicillium hispanicum]|uniref:uncharacterized protein n=1 Tax=Penicillium hispanicum TaxID=1080232 RepID=UPI0025402A8A|nr:uncharacterized protein N7459_008297 [Penicillium hispanicum]KAJ5573870.1 hypothetical protein N7459_008297 [Penicillium hispanicum]
MAGQLTWLITGCSSGLAEALARTALAKGDQIIATAGASKGVNGVERLSALKEAGAAVLELDVAAPPAKLAQIAQIA